jgi:hypothetical protein
MVVVMQERASEAQVDTVIARLIELGMDVHRELANFVRPFAHNIANLDIGQPPDFTENSRVDASGLNALPHAE